MVQILTLLLYHFVVLSRVLILSRPQFLCLLEGEGIGDWGAR